MDGLPLKGGESVHTSRGASVERPQKASGHRREKINTNGPDCRPIGFGVLNMHDNSLPAADRIAPPASSRAANIGRQPAVAIGLGQRGYFRAWCRRGGCISVKTLARARLFPREATETIENTIARLRRKGIEATIVEVTILVGGRSNAGI